jgi:hypothetical protein
VGATVVVTCTVVVTGTVLVTGAVVVGLGGSAVEVVVGAAVPCSIGLGADVDGSALGGSGGRGGSRLGGASVVPVVVGPTGLPAGGAAPTAEVTAFASAPARPVAAAGSAAVGSGPVPGSVATAVAATGSATTAAAVSVAAGGAAVGTLAVAAGGRVDEVGDAVPAVEAASAVPAGFSPSGWVASTRAAEATSRRSAAMPGAR